ncbi:MAG: hypothetical protein AAFR74_00510, partial [Pseudomonadota bacterium]
RLTALIEPLVGPNRVKTSIQKDSVGTLTWLILIDGPALEAIADSAHASAIREIILARGFDPDRDALTIRQQPFAPSATGALNPFEIAELTGLVLVLFALLGLSTQPRHPKERQIEKASISPLPTNPEPQPQNDNSIRQVAALTNAAPDRSAALIRKWMREDQT